MRTWVVTKASRLKAVLSWTKTIWVMVRSMSELRQKHQKKWEAKHVRRCEEKHESKSEAEHENKNEAENQ
jgi:hypothetical protein